MQHVGISSPQPLHPTGTTTGRYVCPQCHARNRIVNECRCDPNNLPTRITNMPEPTPPITLLSLPRATPRQVFEQAKTHLLAQNEQSLRADETTCAYRGYDKLGNPTLRCAAGVFIADSEYSAVFENRSWATLRLHELVPDEHGALIHRLQYIHDQTHPTEWEKRLAELETVVLRGAFGDPDQPPKTTPTK